jgi:hypothetical protein
MIMAPQWYETFALHGLLVAGNAEWHAAGVPRRELEALVAAGELIRVRRGAYATRALLDQAATEPGLGHAIRAAALRATGKQEDSVVSHESAALLHGIDLLSGPAGTSLEDCVSLTVPPGRRTGRHAAPDVSVHVAELPLKHKEERFFRVPVTTGARTVVDIARASTFMRGVVVADSALRLGVATPRAIENVVADCRQWPGVEKARKVAAFATNLSESVLESCARVVFYQHELPPPALQVPIRGRDGTVIARPGFCWPEYGTLADADVMGNHDGEESKAVMARHLERDARLQDLGWEDVHFTWRELFGEQESLLGRLQDAFGHGAKRGGRAQSLPGWEPARAW